jgi:hypothetical protein
MSSPAPRTASNRHGGNRGGFGLDGLRIKVSEDLLDDRRVVDPDEIFAPLCRK